MSVPKVQSDNDTQIEFQNFASKGKNLYNFLGTPESRNRS